jgi:hypothetical protein
MALNTANLLVNQLELQQSLLQEKLVAFVSPEGESVVASPAARVVGGKLGVYDQKDASNELLYAGLKRYIPPHLAP